MTMVVRGRYADDFYVTINGVRTLVKVPEAQEDLPGDVVSVLLDSGFEVLQGDPETSDVEATGEVIFADAQVVGINGELARYEAGVPVEVPDEHLAVLKDADRVMVPALEVVPVVPPEPPEPEEVTLGALTVSPSSVSAAAPVGTVVGTVSGQTAGSSVTLPGSAGGKYELVGSEVRVVGGLVAASTDTLSLTETLSGAIGSPKSSPVNVTVT